MDAGAQNKLKRKEQRLMDLIREMPVTIEYGCHRIELRVDHRNSNDFTFRAIKNDGKGLVIRTQ